MNENIRKVMELHDIKPVKSLGQNFLINKHIREKIIEVADIEKEDLVIEVGAGLGALSKEIAKKAGKLIAIEIDKKLIPILTLVLKDFKNAEIINKDILTVNIGNDLVYETRREGERFAPTNIKVVGNLPYYITTPILMKILEKNLGVEIDEAFFMIQKEVAHRIIAKPGTKDYGSLSLAVQYYSYPEVLFNVSPSSFFPKPKVDSSVIKLNIYKTPPVNVSDEDLFFKLIRASFEQRRKTLVNALFNSGILSLDKEEIKSTLKKLSMDIDIRGERLSLNHFAQLSNIFSQKDC